MKRRPFGLIGMFLAGAGFMALGFVALAFLSNSGSILQSPQEISASPVEVDFPAPDLNLTNVAGNPVSLSDYAGTFVLVNNWATWCPPCRAEMPTLEAYYQDHKADNFVLVGIESGQPASEVAAFVDEYNLSFPIWLDERGIALEAFRNPSLPNSYLIDPQGQVRLTWTGPISQKMLEKHVTPLLEE